MSKPPKQEKAASTQTNEGIATQLQPLAVSIDNIELLPGNPRKGDIEAVARSYKTFGQRKPIVVRRTGQNENGQTGIVIAGNHQLQAARRLGWKTIAAIFVEDDDDMAKAYALADNRTAELGGYDPAALEKLVEELRENNPDLLGATGWTDDDLAEVIGGSLSEKTANVTDKVPDLPKKVTTKLGDVWSLGKHKLICGDSTDAKVYEKLLGKERASLLVTDPPWNVNYGGNDNPRYKHRTIKNDNLSTDDWTKFITGFVAMFKEYTRPGAPAYVVMSAQEWPSIDKALREGGFHWSSTIIWVKDRLVLSRKDYHTQYEPIWQGHNGPFDPIWYGWNEDAARLAEVLDRTQSDVWLVDRPSRSDLHPTTKPIELLTRAIENSSNQGAIVLDPFAGSGSTIMACVATERIGRSIELDPAYCDVIAQRYQEATGNIPLLNGEPKDISANFDQQENEDG
jgi:DNA modification methylase